MLRSFWLAIALIASSAFGQTGPEFEAASLKLVEGPPARGVSTRPQGGPGTSDPGRFSVQHIPLRNLMMLAFDKSYDEILGLESAPEQYTLAAAMPADTTRADFQIMLQRLLTERFRLAVHRETREVPGYDLVVAPDGPRLMAWVPGNPDRPEQDGFPRLPSGEASKAAVLVSGNPPVMRSMHRQTMEQFSVGLSEMVKTANGLSPGEKRARIRNKTGLTAVYEFRLEFEFAIARKGQPVAAEPGGNTLSLFRALEKQLGLKLVKANNAVVDVFVVDHADRLPAEN